MTAEHLDIGPPPRIQYVRSHYGTKLGAWRAGSGPPLVMVPANASAIQSDWAAPLLRFD